MKTLLILGAGTFSTEVEELARLNGFTDIAFLDDSSTPCSSPVIGMMDDIRALRGQYDTAIVALGNNENRKKYHGLLTAANYTIPILVHPTAYVSPDAVLSPGCIIRTHVVVSRYAKLGEGVIINVGGLIDHHCEVGEFSHILMGAVVRNSAKVAPMTWIPSNAVVE